MSTINDVALKAGVSVTTVSRVLNNRGYISEATRKKVFKTMEELNYQPNEIARSLLRKQSNLIGLIIPSVSHPFFSELTNHIEYYAYQNGWKVLLCNSHMDPVKEKDYIGMLKRNRVDGIIMGSHTLEIEEYRNLNSPIVTFDRQIDNEIPFISSDNYQGGVLAAELLISKGCRAIVHVCGNLELAMLANYRNDGFKDTAEKHGIQHTTIQTDMNVLDSQQYNQIVQKMLEEYPEVDGIFASSDIIAACAVRECFARGKRVPQDIRIVGYDDIDMAAWFIPGITTIRQPIEALGSLAVELIQKQLEGVAFEKENLLPVELIERSTT
ncbi:LacI family DNA-binding transcriptional regulator [Paenibacillus sp. YPG26]|uniref:LacI family DNA-binding transcriptional regulator n=1 Tax=Paenibacillus sp. YPG26 TaxID=2878915 RepID=UPI00203B745D|nr:LacI family DNA-binding transcriptional regulator [Paenibacillus sp. YPG26]USB32195.1 LacI family DNA-binding transcriptional regulator [Paenibacillus sp. YPG26]